MSALRLVDLVILGILLLVAIRLVPSAWYMLRVYLRIRARRLEDGSSFAPPAPQAVAAVAEQLQPLGFARIGERSLVLPGNQRRFEWNMVDELTTTYVSIVPVRTVRGGALVGFYSAFADGGFVVTSYPLTETVRRADFDSAPGAATVEETVSLHRQRAADFSRTHGQPLPNRSMAELLVRDDTYRRRHGGLTLRNRVYQFVAVTAVVVVAAGAELLRVIVLDH